MYTSLAMSLSIDCIVKLSQYSVGECQCNSLTSQSQESTAVRESAQLCDYEWLSISENNNFYQMLSYKTCYLAIPWVLTIGWFMSSLVLVSSSEVQRKVIWEW